MTNPRPTNQQLVRKVEKLQARLEEAEETLRALRSGEVDAVVAQGPGGEQVYTLKGADQAYRVMIEQMAEGAVTLTPGGAILFANEQFAALLGQPLERVVGGSIEDCIDAGDLPAFRTLLAEGLRGQAKGELSLKGAREPVPAYLAINRLELEGGDCACVVVTDLTEQKRQAALRESEARARSRARELELVMETVPAVVFIAYDPGCRVMVGNRMAHELLRVPPGGNLSMSAPEGEQPLHFRALHNGRELEARELPVQLAAATGRVVRDYEFDLVFDDGTTRHLLGTAAPLVDESGHRGAVAAFLDVTERRQMEERLRQAQKMESIGVLAGGVAHDFNNLLTGILGNASLLLDSVELADPNRTIAEGVMRGAERAADLTRQLLAYSGRGRFILSPVDFSEQVREITDLLRASIPSSIDVQLELEEEPALIEADRGQMQQIVINLVLNAAEAIGERAGRIAVVTRTRNMDPALIERAGLNIAPGTYVSLEVRDNGCGMEPSVRGRIFEPFFTTKFQGRGLGLAAVQGIVKSHGGDVVVESQLGTGSQFTVLLPASGALRASKAAARAAAVEDLAGEGTILVVDDEPGVRTVARAALERFGYRVLIAESRAEALRLFRERVEEIRLVLLDLTMPGMTGEETIRQMRAIHEVPVLLSSGYNQTEAFRRFAGSGVAGFIGKPYTASALAAKVKEVFSSVAG